MFRLQSTVKLFRNNSNVEFSLTLLKRARLSYFTRLIIGMLISTTKTRATLASKMEI